MNALTLMLATATALTQAHLKEPPMAAYQRWWAQESPEKRLEQEAIGQARREVEEIGWQITDLLRKYNVDDTYDSLLYEENITDVDFELARELLARLEAYERDFDLYWASTKTGWSVATKRDICRKPDRYYYEVEDCDE